MNKFHPGPITQLWAAITKGPAMLLKAKGKQSVSVESLVVFHAKITFSAEWFTG
jgi:hypothetical protein